MTTAATSTQPDADIPEITKVARDLREILELHDALEDQAIAHASSSDIPGGGAMYALGNVANLEAWEHMNATSEALGPFGKAYTSAEDEDPEESWSPFQLLEFWSEAWRREQDAEYEMRHTVRTEAMFLRTSLDWAWRNELHWDEFAADVNRARRKLENILHAGDRAERTHVICHLCSEADGAEGGEEPEEPEERKERKERKEHRLIRQYGQATDGSDDRWKCPNCKHRHDADSVSRAYAKMLRSTSAERWVPQADAIATLREQGRPERTIRGWLADGEGGAFCDPVAHEVWVWWPDLWRRHVTAPTRQRERSA